MSNERPTPADDGDLSAQERRRQRVAAEAVNTAFAARLADVTPRSGIDATVLHYEAGRAAATAEFRRERSFYRGIASASAACLTLTLGLWSWQVAHVPHASPDAGAVAVAVRASEPSPPTTVDSQAVADEMPTAPAPNDDLAKPAIVAKRRLSDPIDFDRLANFDRGASMRWRDVYGPSPRSIDVEGEPVSTTLPSPPEAIAPAPWSAFPSPSRMQSLIQEGI